MLRAYGHAVGVPLGVPLEGTGECASVFWGLFCGEEHVCHGSRVLAYRDVRAVRPLQMPTKSWIVSES